MFGRLVLPWISKEKEVQFRVQKFIEAASSLEQNVTLAAT